MINFHDFRKVKGEKNNNVCGIGGVFLPNEINAFYLSKYLECLGVDFRVFLWSQLFHLHSSWQ